MQVLGKAKNTKYISCTIPTLDHQLSYGIAEDQLLFPIWALIFYLEGSMPWREHKRLLFVSFKSGHKRDIVPSTISGWIRKTILESYTNSPTPLLESHKGKVHQVRSMAASLGFHRQASMEQSLRADTWRCHNTLTDFYLKDLSLYSAGLIQIGPVVAAESNLNSILEIIRGNIVYIPPSIQLDCLPCEATEPG